MLTNCTATVVVEHPARGRQRLKCVLLGQHDGHPHVCAELRTKPGEPKVDSPGWPGWIAAKARGKE